ncbi:MAG: HAMP domain-containing protein [Deltaproteobacteria bacterium]|nr:HAMP domain-containing protein [Deltaproteobacteria bacterium]
MQGSKGLSVRWLLLGVSALILLFPIMALLGLKVYQNHLVRQTESSLIAQSVLIGEAWRDRWLEELNVPTSKAPGVRPRGRAEEKYTPIAPITDLSKEILSPLSNPTTRLENQDGPKWRAGARIIPMLERAKTFNLSSARVLDENGCTISSTGTWLGACFSDLPEVRDALEGRYSAIMRERISDENKPAFSSISRRGDIRVFIATPVFSDGAVAGVVWMSRTSMAPLKAAWLNRRPLFAGLLTCIVLAALTSLFLAWAITRPIRQITEAAESIARGDATRPLDPRGFAFAEIRTLGAALGTMTDQLSDRARYIADFAANVSHELKSPITAIRGAAELLREEWEEMPKDQRFRFLGNIEADASRMERLVARLLELARIQSAPESSEELALADFLARVAESYKGRVSFNADGAPEKTSINPDHLESAVRNLLDNAIRHGGEEQVDLFVKTESGRVSISVSDRGPGISEANQRRIFDRFFTTERDRGGTGLGLAIVGAVAKTRGQEVSLKTGPNGTTFTLKI